MIELTDRTHNQFEALKPKAQDFVQARMFLDSSRSETLSRGVSNIYLSIMSELAQQDFNAAMLVIDRIQEEKGKVNGHQTKV